ncbi:MAG TPA: hypothetical protein VHH15_14535, partial [Actinophytocola sp.]|nr:hypothetical protein [Actinophytocola sp.]
AGHGSVWAFVLAWGGSSLLGAGCGWLQSGITPRLGGVREWLRHHRELGSRYLVENVSNSGAAQLRMYGLGAIAGLSEVGALRGAELLLGPFLALLMGVILLFAVPDALGRLALDDVWAPASELIVPVTLSVTGAGVVAGATAGLRALGAARRSLRAQLIASTGYLGGGLAGAFAAGAEGASWGSAVAMWCGAAVWWWQLRAGLRAHRPLTQELTGVTT